jgi:hypothetical protein
VPRCNLTEAVEDAALEYLKGLLLNRLMKLLGRRAVIALGALVTGFLADSLLPASDIIGLVISIGIGIRTFWDMVKTIRNTIDRYKSGAWKGFINLPQRVLRELDSSLFDCLDRRPECCELFYRKVGNILLKWVQELEPGWKKKSAWHAGVKFKQVKNDIKAQIAEPLRECCQ